MKKFSEKGSKNSILKMVILSIIFIFGYQFGVSYKKYEDSNVGLYEDKEIADRDAKLLGASKGSKILKKITDGENEYYLIIHSHEKDFIGIQVLEVRQEINRFLFFSKKGYRTLIGGEHRTLIQGNSYGKREGNTFYYIDFDNEIPSEKKINLINDYLKAEYSKDIIVENGKDFKLTFSKSDGSKREVELIEEEMEFNGNIIKFIFTKLP